MSYEYTRKGKIGVTIIAIWFVVSAILTLGGIASFLIHTQDIPNANINQITIDYYIAVSGIASLMIGSVIALCCGSGMSSHLDWYEWKET